MKETINSIGADETHAAIAVIGMAGRFPTAKNLTEFWNILEKGRDGIYHFSEKELKEAGVSENLIVDPRYIKARGILEDIDLFDADFFGLTASEATLMDPQQRVFIELCWEALEISGYSTLKERSIGVYAGMSDSTYLHHCLLNNADLMKAQSFYQISIATSNHFLATKISYLLNLTGPSIVVNSACSTSLVAIIEACKSLLNYECDLALAGGISIRVPQINGYLYKEGGIHSSDGRCRAFDNSSTGTVSSNGGGVVVLKRLNEAIQEGDTIDAVIKGFAINNDGAAKIGYTAPSVIEQARCVATALSYINPESISYIETHGSGTRLGDPVEIAALTKAFRHYTAKKNYCAVGSVKTNIGHTDVASGVAGFIKTVLALKHTIIPASLYFNEANPEIAFQDSPFFVNSKTTPWENNFPRCAGVSSFGIGGTNAHLILEEAPLSVSQPVFQDKFIIPLSAKSELALQQQQKNLLDYLQQQPIEKIELANIAYTLQVGRQAFNHRKVFICEGVEELIELLQLNSFIEVEKLEHPCAKKWLATGQADWSLIYDDASLKRIPLPTYPFERQSYWVFPSSKEKPNKIKKIREPAAYQTYWELTSLPTDMYFLESNWLVFIDKLGIGEKIASQLQLLKKNIIEIRAGKLFRQLDSCSFEINPTIKHHYQKLFDSLSKNNWRPHHAMYCWGITDEKTRKMPGISLDDIENTSFTNLIYFSQVFLKKSLNVHFHLITNYLAKILPEDKIFPEQSLLLGNCLVTQQEFPILSTVIDIGKITQGIVNDQLLLLLINECISKPIASLVAYRHGLRFTQRFKPYSMPNRTDDVHLKSNGVYLITGGLGEIGLELAHFLATHYKAHLILTTRSATPFMQILQEYEQRPEQHSTLSPVIKRMLEIKKIAKSLCIIQANVADFDQMKKVFNLVKIRNKKLNGIFHLAAIVDYSTRLLIKDVTINQLQNQWLAKIQGTNILAQLVNEDQIDFCVLFSSIAAVVGGIGLCSYAAANNYLNYFAESRVSLNTKKIKWFSISWDAWKHSSSQITLSNKEEKTSKNALTPQQGMNVIQHYFDTMKNPNLFISFNNLAHGLKEEASYSIIKNKTNNYALGKQSLGTDDAVDIKIIMQRLFQDFLGKEKIDVDSGFYNLGGDSLAAITLLELIEETFSTRITLANFMNNPSVSQLVKLIDTKHTSIDHSFVINLRPEIVTKQTLFFIHPIGGSVFCYLDLINYLPTYSCYAIQDPGLSSSQFNFESLEVMAFTYLQEIKRIQPKGPYLLGGYSFGATIAFELARQLILNNETVEQVFLIDGWAAFSPELHDKNRFTLVMQRNIAELNEHIPATLKQKDLLLDLLWRRMLLLLKYKPSPIPVSLVLFKAQDILSEYQSINEVSNHWSTLSTKIIKIYQITGNHSTLLQLPGAQEIGLLIKKLINN